jgi:DNA mismatch repair protein MutL
MAIHVLAPAVAAGIAAGEVVERPASVVKELVENALDAGATSVVVELTDGGMECIRVSDNGCGIPANEVELAFTRHATSKLATLDDLDRITTMGFRGEALPSIAAAAQVTVVTREAGTDVATWVELKGGGMRHGNWSAAPGTTVTVEELFGNIPARRKFLRSAGAETGRVRRVAEHMALAFPEVSLVLTSDGKPLFRTAGNGSLQDVVAAVYDPEMAAVMLEVVAQEAAPYTVRGLISPAATSKTNRTAMHLFLNQRWVQDRALQVAIHEAYQGFLLEGRFPVTVLFLEVPPQEVDVNVHPAKREVRFIRERDAFSSVQRAVRGTLLASSPIVEGGGSLASPRAQEPVSAVAPSFAFNFDADREASTAFLPHPGAAAGPTIPSLRVLGQVSSTYLVAEGPDGMYLIDQHAAHEQVLFDRLLRQWEDHHSEVQPLLEPMPVELTPEQMDGARETMQVVEALGFHMEPFGEGSWLVRAVPAMARQVSIPRLVQELLDPQRDPTLAGLPTHYALAASIACHSAVRAGQTLDPQEMTALVESLTRCRNPRHCPHGRPTTIRLSTRMLAREFGRI